MRKNPYISLFALIIMLIFSTISAADSSPETVAGKAESNEKIGISIEKAESNEGIEQCKHCGRFVKNGNIHRDAVTIVGRQLEEGLNSRRIGISGGKKQDKYINVYIFRFEERKGGNYSVEKPAGVGFHMHLYENSILKQIFVFDEDQKSLTENIFNIGLFFKRGGKWITAEQLSGEGIEKGLEFFIESLPAVSEKDSMMPTEEM
jgi:hypothetical protein